MKVGYLTEFLLIYQTSLTDYQVKAQSDWPSRGHLTIYTHHRELVNHALKVVSTTRFRGFSEKNFV